MSSMHVMVNEEPPNNIPPTRHQLTSSVLDSTKIQWLWQSWQSTPHYSLAIEATLVYEANGYPPPMQHHLPHSPKTAICSQEGTNHQGTSSGGPFFERRGSSVWPLVCWIRALAAGVAVPEDGNQHYILRRSENTSVTTDSPTRNAERRFAWICELRESETQLHTRHWTRAFSAPPRLHCKFFSWLFARLAKILDWIHRFTTSILVATPI